MSNLGDERRNWLGDFDWAQIIELNLRICEKTGSFHGPTSDGHAPCRERWQREHQKESTFREMLEFLRECHRLAPFCFNNGNSFAAVAREIVMDLGKTASDAAILRSAAGHYVAGVLRDDELDAILAGFQ